MCALICLNILIVDEWSHKFFCRLKGFQCVDVGCMRVCLSVCVSVVLKMKGDFRASIQKYVKLSYCFLLLNQPILGKKYFILLYVISDTTKRQFFHPIWRKREKVKAPRKRIFPKAHCSSFISIFALWHPIHEKWPYFNLKIAELCASVCFCGANT